ncbi:Uncharacterised protein [Shigella sonnei]|nr:Uncharacterised protein [Shigella sonnei]
MPPIPFSIVAAILSSGIPEKRPAPMDTTIKARKACIRAFMTKNSSSKTDPTAVKTSVNVVTTYLPFLITSMVLATTPSSG